MRERKLCNFTGLTAVTRTPENPMGNLSRRAMLGATGGLIAGGLLKTQADAITLDETAATPEGPPSAPQEAPQDPTKVIGRFTSDLGERAPGEQPRRIINRPSPSSSSRTPLQDLRGIITPADLHFERHHAGIPAIDPERYELLIHGMVDRPMTFSLSDLKRYPATSQLCFVECSGNGGAAYRTNAAREVTPQQIDGLTSTSEWTGVPLSTLLREVGAHEDATWLLAEGGDAAVMGRSVPMEKAWDDAMIGYGQNGEAIRPDSCSPAGKGTPRSSGFAASRYRTSHS